MTLLLALHLATGCSRVSAPTTPAATVPDDGPNVLFASDLMRLDRVRWRDEREAGVAWRVRLPRDAALSVLPSPDVVPLRDLAPSGVASGTWALINGGFYEDGAMGLVRSGGVTHTERSAVGGSGILSQQGDRVEVVHRDAWDGTSPEAVQSIDRLIVDGESVVTNADPGATRAARSAVALTEDHVWLILQAADVSVARNDPTAARIRDPYGHGMTLYEFAAWLREDLGATSAINLDGGLSTNLIVHTDAFHFDLEGADGTINGILFRPRSPTTTSSASPHP